MHNRRRRCPKPGLHAESESSRHNLECRNAPSSGDSPPIGPEALPDTLVLPASRNSRQWDKDSSNGAVRIGRMNREGNPKRLSRMSKSAPWIVNTYRWALSEFDSYLRPPCPVLLPTDEFFPVQARSNPALAEDLFRCVRQHTGTMEWPIRIEPQESCEGPLLELPTGVVLDDPEPAATFRRDPTGTGQDVIYYHPELLNRPTALVAILGHGLSHHLMNKASSKPPGGYERWDYATDLVAVALGLGVFLANSAHVVAWEEGIWWEGPAVRCQGWLSQAELAEAFALFCHVNRVAFNDVREYLTDSPRVFCQRALGKLPSFDCDGWAGGRRNR